MRKLALAFTLALVSATLTAAVATAGGGWSYALASSYSTADSPGWQGCPGYGRLRDDTLTFASRDSIVPCGARVTFCYRARCVTAVRSDSGPWVAGRSFDLAAGTTRALCGCSAAQWGVRLVRWKLAHP